MKACGVILCLLFVCRWPSLTRAGQTAAPQQTLDTLPWGLVTEKLRQYQALLPNLSSRMDQTVKAAWNVSQQCQSDVLRTVEDLIIGEPYAVQMLDAAAKIPAGLSEGTLKFQGAYDTCVNILPVVNKTTFGGRYCTANIDISDMLPNMNNTTSAFFVPNSVILAYSLCVPDSCDEDSVLMLMNSVLEALTVDNTFRPQSVDCAVPRPFYTGDIVALTITGLLVLLLVVGTIVDVVLKYITSWKLRDPTALFESTSDESEDKPLLHREESGSGSLYSSVSTEHGVGMPQHGLFWRICMCFSVISNGEKILQTEGETGTIMVLHGIRVLSIWWVVLGHTVLFIALYTDNILTVIEMSKRFSFLAITNGTLAVDTFFFLSGLLVCYIVLKKLEEGDGRINWGLFYFHRIWRLTPALAFVVMFYTTIFPHLPNVPKGPGIVEDKCPEYWWSSLLYINNFYPLKFTDVCLQWTWYLACDFQFFAISPIFLILLYFKPRLGGLIVILVTFLSVIGTLLVSQAFGQQPFATLFYFGQALMPRNLYPVEGFDYLYSKPYTRIPPYLIGMLMGYVMYCTKCKETYRFRKISVVACWMAVTAIALAVVYGFYGNVQDGVAVSYELATFYNGTARFAWSLCLAWTAFACIHGIGGPVTVLLSWRFWKPLSHLTYCVYLVHPIWMMVYTNYIRRQIHLDDLTLIYLFIGNLVISYVIAFCVSLLVESPLLALEKIIFGVRMRPKGVWEYAADRKEYY